MDNNYGEISRTVKAKSNYITEPKSSYSGDAFGILISIGLIIGGLSGRMVLRGTQSSTALVVVGFLFLAWDIISIFKKKSNIEKAENEWYQRSSRMYDQENAVKADERRLPGLVNITITCEKGVPALDFGARLNGSTLTRDAKTRISSGSTERVRNILNFNNLDLTAVFDIDNTYASEIEIRMIKESGILCVVLPDSVTPVPLEEQA